MIDYLEEWQICIIDVRLNSIKTLLGDIPAYVLAIKNELDQYKHIVSQNFNITIPIKQYCLCVYTYFYQVAWGARCCVTDNVVVHGLKGG